MCVHLESSSLYFSSSCQTHTHIETAQRQIHKLTWLLKSCQRHKERSHKILWRRSGSHGWKADWANAEAVSTHPHIHTRRSCIVCLCFMSLEFDKLILVHSQRCQTVFESRATSLVKLGSEEHRVPLWERPQGRSPHRFSLRACVRSFIRLMWQSLSIPLLSHD